MSKSRDIEALELWIDLDLSSNDIEMIRIMESHQWDNADLLTATYAFSTDELAITLGNDGRRYIHYRDKTGSQYAYDPRLKEEIERASVADLFN